MALNIVDDLLSRVLSVGKENLGMTKTVKEKEILTLCALAKKVFLSQPMLIEINPPVLICGDTHGQYSDLLRLYSRGGFPPQSNYLFLGDYVDRGSQSLEVICVQFSYKIKYPNNFFVLRGNHECHLINRAYGFYEECIRRFSSVRLWQAFQDVFAVMPLCGLVGERILCMHGGLSPYLNSFDQLRNIARPCEPANCSLEMDLLWADPVPNITGFQPNMRGASYGFGEDVVADVCNRFQIDMIARAHQVVQDGYEFFANRRLVTVFSAPHYCGQFDNAAAIMRVDANLVCSFQILRPTMGLKKTVIVKTVRTADETLCDDKTKGNTTE